MAGTPVCLRVEVRPFAGDANPLPSRFVVATIVFGPGAVVLLGVGAVFGVLFAVVLAVRYAASFPDLPPPGPETSDLGPEPPAVANLLVNRCSVTRAAAAATVVDLAARQHLELLEAGPGHFVVRVRPERPEPLTDYERQVLDLVRVKATGGSAPLEAIRLDADQGSSWHSRFAKRVVSDARARGLLRGRWSQLDWSVFGALAALAVFFVAGGLFAAHVQLSSTSSAPSSNGGRFAPEDWFWVAAVAWAAIIAFVARLRSVRYSTTGVGATSRWLGVRRFLRHDPTFADAPPAAVAIWDRLLAYGTALGAARRDRDRDPARHRGPGDRVEPGRRHVAPGPRRVPPPLRVRAAAPEGPARRAGPRHVLGCAGLPRAPGGRRRARGTWAATRRATPR